MRGGFIRAFLAICEVGTASGIAPMLAQWRVKCQNATDPAELVSGGQAKPQSRTLPNCPETKGFWGAIAWRGAPAPPAASECADWHTADMRHIHNAQKRNAFLRHFQEPPGCPRISGPTPGAWLYAIGGEGDVWNPDVAGEPLRSWRSVFHPLPPRSPGVAGFRLTRHSARDSIPTRWTSRSLEVSGMLRGSPLAATSMTFGGCGGPMARPGGGR